jgi:hypothetical protein
LEAIDILLKTHFKFRYHNGYPVGDSLTRWTHRWWWRPGAKIYALVLDCTENMNDDRANSTLNIGC